MHQIRYFSYLIFSIIGGIVFSKIIPGVDIFTGAIWLMMGNILYELLQWKYGVNDNEQNDK